MMPYSDGRAGARALQQCDYQARALPAAYPCPGDRRAKYKSRGVLGTPSGAANSAGQCVSRRSTCCPVAEPQLLHHRQARVRAPVIYWALFLYLYLGLREALELTCEIEAKISSGSCVGCSAHTNNSGLLAFVEIY